MMVKTIAMQGNRKNSAIPADEVGLVKRIVDVILNEVVTARFED